MNLTNEEIRIKVAEAHGTMRWSYALPTKCIGASVPNYPEDLNACAEFEATLTDDELWEYSKLLMDYRQAANGFPLASRSEVLKLQKATARQRCIAFIKTLNLEPV